MSQLNSFSKYILLILSIFALQVISCDSVQTDNHRVTDDNSSDSNHAEWLIPKDEVIDGGPGKDGIPSIDDPNYIRAFDVDYLQDDRLVLGVLVDDEVRLFPHQIMDWHEIVNDKADDGAFSLTYCPLTGTGIAFDREINNSINEFGVSGLLFRNNLIMYDRATDSNWSQMQLRSVNGELVGTTGKTMQAVETTWENWKQMYPSARVLSIDTGFDRNYNGYAYGYLYATDDDYFIFEPKRIDDRLPNKAYVHGVMPPSFDGEETAPRIYPYEELSNDVELIREQYEGMNLLIVGSSNPRIGASFVLEDGQNANLEFEAVQGELPVIMTDNEGNEWTIFGEAINGPRTGERLTSARSFNGYWFGFADFYPNSCIYPNTSCN